MKNMMEMIPSQPPESISDLVNLLQKQTGNAFLTVEADFGFVPMPDFIGMVVRDFEGMTAVGQGDPVYTEFCELVGLPATTNQFDLAERLNEHYSITWTRICTLLSASVTSWESENILGNEEYWSQADVSLMKSRWMALASNVDQVFMQNPAVITQMIPHELFERAVTSIVNSKSKMVSQLEDELAEKLGRENVDKLRETFMEMYHATKAKREAEEDDDNWDDTVFLKGDDDKIH